MGCGSQIKLSRKPDNSGWERFELDGTTVHKCQKQKQQQQPQQASVATDASVIELLQQINEKLNALLTNESVKSPTS